MFPSAQPMQAHCFRAEYGRETNKKPLLLLPGENPDRRDWAGSMSKGSY